MKIITIVQEEPKFKTVAVGNSETDTLFELPQIRYVYDKVAWE